VGILSIEFHVAEEHYESMTRRIKYEGFFSGVRNYSLIGNHRFHFDLKVEDSYVNLRLLPVKIQLFSTGQLTEQSVHT
jgi:hypothetical protein